MSVRGDRMETVTIRDLRNHGGDVVDRVVGGEAVVVTRDGRPVAELRPVRARGVAATALLARWRRLSPVDPTGFRRDIETVLEWDL